ncbi:MAG: hypothetical protein IPI59_05180 [Sphingobacteriales bacterium]|jgi:hypothetical protein|nr:hypothetical protein [Sphingobacteriales bacterium]MBP9140510.1 hypothetical protein [Chitinophagales bacterium]MDA0199722.1 hypothetical protein [Bacteroidota bacterium]MBK7526941.1 hypothetical protein [Sphingobacteriales bacterium]MBK8677431.1 hypothetical protein [Sphingobacteriales bacterium]
MNKNKLYLLCLCLLGNILTLQSQSILPQSVNAAGGSYSAGGYSIDFSSGETVIATVSSPNNIITQGFHQPFTTSTGCAVKIWLQGPFNGTEMTTTLQTGSNLIPLAQPFNTLPWNYSGGESVAAMPVNATDWVLLELRTTGGFTGSDLVAQKAALLYKDGSIHDISGNAAVEFTNVASGNYYIAVKPRGNLAVLSANLVVLPNTGTPYDFTTGINKAFGSQQQVLVGGQACLRAGDNNNDGKITVADFNRYQTELIGGSLNIYKTSDLNKDRNITIADFNLYLPNSGIIGAAAINY